MPDLKWLEAFFQSPLLRRPIQLADERAGEGGGRNHSRLETKPNENIIRHCTRAFLSGGRQAG